MNSTPTVMVVVAVMALMMASATGFNITRLLDQHSEFSSFNAMLSQTGVAEAVNGRQTITVLALDNSAVGGIGGRSSDVMKAIIATHVVLDYYDATKLATLSKNKSAVLTTLYQSTGKANGMQGFLNVTIDESQVVFGSAAKGAQHDSHLVKVIEAQPFNISVLQISSVIIPPGLEESSSMAPMTAPPPRKVGPPPPAAQPSMAPAADDSDAPASGPAAADDDVADKEAKKKSGGAQFLASSAGVLLAAAVLLGATL